jgi:hypothetical protein
MGRGSIRRLSLAACAGAGLALCGPAAGASVPAGTITAQSGWRVVAHLAKNVTVSRKTITVAGYRGTRTLTKIAWIAGNPHVSLSASAVVPSRYGAAEHSFGEGRISALRRSRSVFAGINGDTFCPGCARDGGDLLHGLLVHNRRILATGAGPAVGYGPNGHMVMAPVQAVPLKLGLPNGPASIVTWNALSVPGRVTIGDQVDVLTRAGATFSIPATSTALVLTGAVSVGGTPSTAAAVFGNMLRLSAPYADPRDRITGTAGKLEWVNAYRIRQSGGTPVSTPVPVSPVTVSGANVKVPEDGVVLVAPTTSTAGQGLIAAAAAGTVTVPLDDQGWGAVANVMDGKFQMVEQGVAQTRYPGWSDSWPWYCQGPGWGCVRAAVAQKGRHGWLIVVKGRYGTGLTMPDYGRVLAQLGVTNAMGFDSNTHADFWRRGARPITADGWEPGAPAATVLHYR